MIIIEFLGVPCAGKSQISHELGAIMEDNGISICERQYELSHTESKYVRALSKILKTMKMCVLHPCTSFHCFKTLRNISCWLNYMDILGTATDKNVLIFEQGLCQCIGSLFDNEKSDEDTIQKIYDTILPNQSDRIVVCVSLEKAVLIKRMEMREDKPFYYSSGDVSITLDNSINTVKMLRDCWKSKYGEKCLVDVSNDEDNQSVKVARKIFDALKENGSI